MTVEPYRLKGTLSWAAREIAEIQCSDPAVVAALDRIRRRLALALEPTPALLQLVALRENAWNQSQGVARNFGRRKAEAARALGYPTWAALEDAVFNGELQ